MMNEDGEEANPVLIYTSTFELRGVFVARRVESYSANTRGENQTWPNQTLSIITCIGTGTCGLVDKETNKDSRVHSLPASASGSISRLYPVQSPLSVSVAPATYQVTPL